MSAKRSNAWLDLEESDGSESIDGHDVIEDSRGSMLSRRSKKRSKPNLTDSDLDISDVPLASESKNSSNKVADENLDLSASNNNEPKTKNKVTRDRVDPKLMRQAKFVKDKAIKTGVIYISRIPPFMKPQKVRHLLSPYGSIGRIFLTPEDATIHTRRVKLGGNKKRSYVDGWVEFSRKKDAKLVADALNTQPIGGRKGNWYHDDVWNIKYLKNFKWDDLTEQIASQDAAIADKLRREISQSTKETNVFLENIERARMLDSIKTKRINKNIRNAGETRLSIDSPDDWKIRRFAQNKSGIKRPKANKEAVEQTDKVLMKIF